MLRFLFRCQCGWKKTDHEYFEKDNKQESWKPNDVILDKTNAYDKIEFQGAGKSTRAEVIIKLGKTLL